MSAKKKNWQILYEMRNVGFLHPDSCSGFCTSTGIHVESVFTDHTGYLIYKLEIPVKVYRDPFSILYFTLNNKTVGKLLRMVQKAISLHLFLHKSHIQRGFL